MLSPLVRRTRASGPMLVRCPAKVELRYRFAKTPVASVVVLGLDGSEVKRFPAGLIGTDSGEFRARRRAADT